MKRLKLGNHKFTLDRDSEDGLCLCGYGRDSHRDTDGLTLQERIADEAEKAAEYQRRNKKKTE